MNTNLSSTKAGFRMNRVQKISKGIRLCLQYGFPLWILIGLVVVSLKDPLLREFYGLKSPVAHSPAVQSANVLSVKLGHVTDAYWILYMLAFLFLYRTLFKMFGLFEKGVLFTAETVRCILALGGIFIVKCLLAWTFQFFFPSNRIWSWESGADNLFAGVFLVAIGWLIDEGRKIQEEQELTV